MITLKEHHYSPDWSFALTIRSTASEHEEPRCLVHLALFTHSFWFRIPAWLKPERRWVPRDDASVHRHHKDNGYFITIPHEYGFYVDKTALHVRYGIQPGNWSRDDPKNSDHSKCWFLPWNEQRRVKYDFFDQHGNYFTSAPDKPNRTLDFKAIDHAERTVPKSVFTFNDFDGELITATCHQTLMAWRYGTGWFKFVQYLRPELTVRELKIEFSTETGREKGLWKGGVTGTSIKINQGQSPLIAFTKYGNEVARVKGYPGFHARGFANITEVTDV